MLENELSEMVCTLKAMCYGIDPPIPEMGLAGTPVGDTQLTAMEAAAAELLEFLEEHPSLKHHAAMEEGWMYLQLVSAVWQGRQPTLVLVKG